MKELASQEVDTPDCERTKEYRSKFQSGDGVADEGDKESLDVDKETLASKVGWIEEFEVTTCKCLEGINAIGGFVRVESHRDIFDIGKTNDKSEEQDSKKCTENHSRGNRMRHIFFICFYATIIANYMHKEKSLYEYRN